jgi:hypothetical protein
MFFLVSNAQGFNDSVEDAFALLNGGKSSHRKQLGHSVSDAAQDSTAHVSSGGIMQAHVQVSIS